VLIGDVGGSFGLKAYVPREEIAIAMASKQLGRPVKWIEDRNEHLLASGHAREESIEVEAAVKDDGTLLGIKARLVLDQGAYPVFPYPSSLMVNLIERLLPGPYKVRGYKFDSVVVATNKCSHVAYRGPWAVETWVRERLLDVIARELGLDTAEVRRKNMTLGEPEDRMVTFPSLAGVSSRQSLDKALELANYDGFRSEQETARAEGRYLGIGFATFIEMAPGPPEVTPPGDLFGSEPARVRLEADGHLTVYTQQSPSGQGHETTLAQIAADEMGVPFEHVRVVTGDTRLTPFAIVGTGDSRAATWASGAVMMTTRRVKEKVLAIAADKLEISPDDLEIVDGQITPKGVPDRAIPLAQIAYDAQLAPENLPRGADTNLEATERYRREGVTGSGWSGGTHLCTVEVDLETGGVRILRYLVVEDCGRIINPSIVDGQIRGGVAQGIGGVLYEHSAYDGDGQCLSGTLMDYLIPTAMEIPFIEIHHLESGLTGEVDFRGVGEGGAIVAPATLTNAIEDALAPLGVRVTEQYLPPCRILELAGVVPTS
jgi:carbon-monoxide dehydrogenase large subunit